MERHQQMAPIADLCVRRPSPSVSLSAQLLIGITALLSQQGPHCYHRGSGPDLSWMVGLAINLRHSIFSI